MLTQVAYYFNSNMQRVIDHVRFTTLIDKKRGTTSMMTLSTHELT